MDLNKAMDLSTVQNCKGEVLCNNERRDLSYENIISFIRHWIGQATKTILWIALLGWNLKVILIILIRLYFFLLDDLSIYCFSMCFSLTIVSVISERNKKRESWWY